MYTTSVYFNNVNLNSIPGVKAYNYNTNDLPARNLTMSKLARRDKSLLTSAEYSSKNIYIYVFVGGDTADEIQANFDTLKGYIQEPEGVIRVNQGGDEVEYVGTLNGITDKKYVGPTLSFTLQFVCADPIGKDAVGRELFDTTVITSSTYTKNFTVEGSFAASPRFSLTYSSITSGTNKSISILNASTGKGIKITRNFSSGDIVTINSDTFEVIVNGAPTDFQGQFPTFLPGSRSLQYIDDFSARSVSLSSTYTRQYS